VGLPKPGQGLLDFVLGEHLRAVHAPTPMLPFCSWCLGMAAGVNSKRELLSGTEPYRLCASASVTAALWGWIECIPNYFGPRWQLTPDGARDHLTGSRIDAGLDPSDNHLPLIADDNGFAAGSRRA
jgi:hypothetical protein